MVHNAGQLAQPPTISFDNLAPDNVYALFEIILLGRLAGCLPKRKNLPGLNLYGFDRKRGQLYIMHLIDSALLGRRIQHGLLEGDRMRKGLTGGSPCKF